jgi:putative copper export protein
MAQEIYPDDAGFATITFMRDWLWWILASAHLLAGAAWFGAMFYSLMVLHPRAGRFFGADDEKFESFISILAQGARWKVLSALGLIALTGAAMIPLTESHSTNHWKEIILAKVILWLMAVGIFCRVSWRLWPARVFAVPKELPAIRRRFRASAIMMICIAAAAMVLGLWAHGR